MVAYIFDLDLRQASSSLDLQLAAVRGSCRARSHLCRDPSRGQLSAAIVGNICLETAWLHGFFKKIQKL